MNLSKLRPANWFKHEDDDNAKSLPAQYSDRQLSSREAFHSEIDRLFDDIFKPFPLFRRSPLSGDYSGTISDILKPSLDLKATDAAYQISVELPGVNDEDISIEIDNGALVISGEKKQEKEDKDDKQGLYRMERSYGAFRRVLALPDDADAENIKADFKKGVLSISIPRTGESSKKKIPLNRG